MMTMTAIENPSDLQNLRFGENPQSYRCYVKRNHWLQRHLQLRLHLLEPVKTVARISLKSDHQRHAQAQRRTLLVEPWDQAVFLAWCKAWNSKLLKIHMSDLLHSMLIALLVYLVGGCVYQRTVMHQRGWRQLPNYSMWAGICGCFIVSALWTPIYKIFFLQS